MAKDGLEIGTEPGHPGAFVHEEVLAPLGLGIAKAGRALGVRRATLSDLADEKAAPSPEMALRIEKAFGLDTDQMPRMQAWHDAAAMRERAVEIDLARYAPEPEAG